MSRAQVLWLHRFCRLDGVPMSNGLLKECILAEHLAENIHNGNVGPANVDKAQTNNVILFWLGFGSRIIKASAHCLGKWNNQCTTRMFQSMQAGLFHLHAPIVLLAYPIVQSGSINSYNRPATVDEAQPGVWLTLTAVCCCKSTKTLMTVVVESPLFFLPRFPS